jgi:hypothetical protein
MMQKKITETLVDVVFFGMDFFLTNDVVFFPEQLP